MMLKTRSSRPLLAVFSVISTLVLLIFSLLMVAAPIDAHYHRKPSPCLAAGVAEGMILLNNYAGLTDACECDGQNVPLDLFLEVPADYNCKECGANSMIITCSSPTLMHYCCGPQCATAPPPPLPKPTPQIDVGAAIGAFVQNGVDVKPGQGLTQNNPVVLSESDVSVVGVPQDGFVYVTLPVAFAYGGVGPYDIEITVNGQVVWKGTQALGFAPPKSFKALVPSGQTITYAARVIDSRGQKATSNLYFTARVGQGLPCSPTDVQPNVDASACNGVKAGATCTLSCTSGYVSTGNPATYTCDPENPDMDVGAFSCRKTACVPININNGVDASNCNVEGGEQCVLNCDSGYIQSGTSSSPTVQCPSNGGSLDVSAFKCTTRPAGVCSAVDVNDHVDASMCSGITAGAQCQPQCLSGYKPSGTTSFKCPSNGGDIDVSSFTCAKVTCTVTNAGSNVDIDNCQNLPAGDSCYAQCNNGFYSTNNGLFSCPATGGSINVAGFACVPIPPNVCEAVDANPHVNATACDIVAGQMCQISCFNGYVPTGASASYSCPSGGGSIDVSDFTCGKVVDCEGAWSDWTACTVTCGDGTQGRTYAIDQQAQHGGEECPNEEGDVQSQKCPGIPCDGGWSEWTEGPCRGDWTRERVRECNNPAPTEGGEPCGGSATEGRYPCCFAENAIPNIGRGFMSYGDGYYASNAQYTRPNMAPSAAPTIRSQVATLDACGVYCQRNLRNAKQDLTASVYFPTNGTCGCYDTAWINNGAQIQPVLNAQFQPVYKYEIYGRQPITRDWGSEWPCVEN